jgi:NADPH-dependent 2,4-dienoyl-CoA reductase/sulfur reductase-like enzyme
MKRRAFVLKGLAASAATLGGLSGARSQEAPIDVLIIGAGLAGLACARR